jgi:large-conductance mechanosensitive channel
VNEEEKTLLANMFRVFLARMTALAADESGMSTVEYAIGTIAAAAFGAILYAVVTGDSIVSALTNIIGRALNTKV